MSDTEVSNGIVVNPRRCGGRPTVKGTRITAEMVANLMRGPTAMSPDEIREGYPSLTYADISNVKGWDRKGRPGPYFTWPSLEIREQIEYG